MNRFLLGGIGCSFLGLLLYVVGIATTGWLSQADPESGARADMGLWQTCLTELGVTICKYPDIGLLPGAFHATRAFAVIGALLLFPGLALACFAAKKNSNKAKMIGGGMIIAAGICGAIAAAIFTGDTLTRVGSVVSIPFGYSFYLTWVQTVFTVGGGVAIICSGRIDEEDEIPMVR